MVPGEWLRRLPGTVSGGDWGGRCGVDGRSGMDGCEVRLSPFAVVASEVIVQDC